MATNEQWRAVPGTDGQYEVSNLGRFRRYLKPFRSVKGKYWQVSLPDPTKPKGRKVFLHVLVAELFIGPCPDGMEVCHKDEDGLNPVISNLEYRTHKNNMRTSKRAKLTPADVRYLRHLYKAGNTNLTALGKQFGIGGHQAGVVIRGIQWSDVV